MTELLSNFYKKKLEERRRRWDEILPRLLLATDFWKDIQWDPLKKTVSIGRFFPSSRQNSPNGQCKTPTVHCLSPAVAGGDTRAYYIVTAPERAPPLPFHGLCENIPSVNSGCSKTTRRLCTSVSPPIT
ncbi:hypothetical protein H6P81_000485 [Aristolochia fimbriata]|uniref:Uncharacterized protein n=1 Tax=Aristolochia fimbriata TaxID=158543 RepID=A0AAV7F4D8_ARIFI|nr:hypothetical protein H6P81_000485 [Aristolochia fimbriata]